MLDMRVILRHEHVLAQRLDTAVMRELLAAIIVLGRLGKDFDDEGGIEQCIALIIGEFFLPASNDHIGIRVQSRAVDSQTEVARIYIASALF